MTFGIAIPTSIGPGANPPAYSPVGGAVVTGTITLQDLARGVAVYANRFEGGQQVVRAAMDRHCSAADVGIQFLAFVEEEAYGYLQFDSSGQRIASCLPVITLRKSDVLTDARIDLLVKAFKDKEVSIEYVMGGKDNGVYSDEIDRLGRKLIDAEVGDYVLVFDQSDSVMMRRRHNTSEPHIKTIADMLSRQYPVVGYIASGTGPGNAVIEGVRRAETFVGKKLTTFDKIYGFSGVTSRDVVDNWEKGFGYQWVGLEHAWKHSRSGRDNPVLLDLPTASAILDGNRHGIKLVDHPTVAALRSAMSKAKSKKGGKKGGKGTKAAAGRQYSAKALVERRGGLFADIDSLLKQDGYTCRVEARGIAGLLVQRTQGRAKGRTTSGEVYAMIKATPSIQAAASFGNACQKTMDGAMSVTSMGLLHLAIAADGGEAAIAYMLGIAGRTGGSPEGQDMRRELQAMTCRKAHIARYEASHARWLGIAATAETNVVEMPVATEPKALPKAA